MPGCLPVASKSKKLVRFALGQSGADTEKINKGRILGEGLRNIWRVCLEILPLQQSKEKPTIKKKQGNPTSTYFSLFFSVSAPLSFWNVLKAFSLSQGVPRGLKWSGRRFPSFGPESPLMVPESKQESLLVRFWSASKIRGASGKGGQSLVVVLVALVVVSMVIEVVASHYCY